MSKSEQEILEELEKKYRSNLFDKNNELNWHSIDGTMKSWLEIGDDYLEKCTGYGSGEKTDILCINKSLDYIISEDEWEAKAEKNGDIIRFDPYDHENSVDSYVSKKYSLKSKEQIQKILDTNIDELDLVSISLNATNALKDNSINTVGDIVKLEPNELFIKMQDAFGPELKDDAAALTVGAVMEAGLAWDNGKFVYNEWKEDGKYKFHEALVSSLQDDVITPDEADKLSEIAEKYGLSKEYRETVVSNHIENQHNTFGKPRPVIAHPIPPQQALSFSSCFNMNKYEIEKNAVKDLQNEPVPYFDFMSVELGKEILETLSVDGGYTVYGDLNKNKFWLRDEQTGETEETNFNHILSKVQMITESWNRDETTVNENKFIEKLNSLYTDDIVIPFDLHYKFKIPEEIKAKNPKEERRLKTGIESAIQRVFHESSEIIKGSITTENGQTVADYTFRHNIVCSKESNYSNLNSEDFNKNLQLAIGTSLNDWFGLDHKILFAEEIKASIPKEFKVGRRTVLVDKESIEKFAKPVEESWKIKLHTKVFNEYLFEEKKNNSDVSYYLASEIKIPDFSHSRPMLLSDGEFRIPLTLDNLKIASVGNNKEWAEKYCEEKNNSYVSYGGNFYVYDNHYLKAVCHYFDPKNRNKLDIIQNPPSEEFLQNWQQEKKLFDKVLSENPLLKKYVEEQWSVLKEESKDYIHSEEFISKFGDWEKANRLEKLKNAESLVHNNDIIINNENISEKIEELREKNDVSSLRKIGEQIGKYVFQNLRKQQNLLGEKDKVLIHNDDKNLEVIFPMSGVRETKEHNATTKGHIEAIAYIPEIIKNGIYIASEKNEDNRRPHIEHFEYFATGIKLHNEDFTCKSVFGVTKSGKVYYDQSLSEIEKGNLVDIMLKENKVLQRVPSNRKGEAGLDSLKAFNPQKRQDNFEPWESKSPSEYYDKRLINICQVPQMPYLEMKDGKWQPKEEAIQAVKDGKLYIEKIGQNYQMHDSLNLAEKIVQTKQPITLDSFMKDVETQCGDDKSVKNILLQSANLIKNLDENSKNLLREEFSKAEIKGQDSLVDFLDKKINPKKETKRSIQKSKDSDFERTR